MTSTHRDSDESQVPIDPVVLVACDRLLPGHEGEDPVGGRPFLVRLPYQDQRLRVRRWPVDTIGARVRFVHRLQRHLAEVAPGLTAAPAVTPALIELDGALVDVQTWLPGLPSGGRSTPQFPDGHSLHRPNQLDPNAHRRLAMRIAELHLQTQQLATRRDTPFATVDQVMTVVNRRWSDWRVRLRPAAPRYPPIQRWLRLGEQVLPAAQDALGDGRLDALPRIIAHLDLWPAHVLVDDEAIRLLDLGAAAAATPLFDLAQLVTRFAGWTGEHAEAVIADYTAVRQLAPDERRLLPAVAALDLIVESARLLLYGYAGGLPASAREAAAARKGALEMLDSLEAVRPAVVRATPFVSHAKQRQLARIATGKTKSSGPRKPPTKPTSRKPAGSNKPT